ncbi:MAG: bifunctional adenosylcobinamide kinase/adenosylcobinamide-phosphate guanylyltransferase [Lachnospiraceae bacterium]|nr:bifunctional adenosylcobinamide kinase/adenosylcobinamide-phosphate guanylyltransferase [Lachnospiraceae bacterium]
MMSLIVGASASGKSEFAEERALERYNRLKDSVSSVRGGIKQYAFSGELIYLATMINSDEETKERISCHVKRRESMHFNTLEVPYDLGKIAAGLKANSVCLLECLSNLLANEMFSDPERKTDYGSMSDKVLEDIRALKRGCHDLIIVSNNVFEDGIEYDGETAVYIKYLGELNRKLGALSDEVYEVVAGIPIKIKERNSRRPDSPGANRIRWV